MGVSSSSILIAVYFKLTVLGLLDVKVLKLGAAFARDVSAQPEQLILLLKLVLTPAASRVL